MGGVDGDGEFGAPTALSSLRRKKGKWNGPAVHPYLLQAKQDILPPMQGKHRGQDVGREAAGSR